MRCVTARDILNLILRTLHPKNNQLVLLPNVITTPASVFPLLPLPVTARQNRKLDFIN